MVTYTKSRSAIKFNLRYGGVSAAANAGIPDRWFKWHGRWLSENAKDGDIKDKLEERFRYLRIWVCNPQPNYFL